jgi:hypothetical protein
MIEEKVKAGKDLFVGTWGLQDSNSWNLWIRSNFNNAKKFQGL